MIELTKKNADRFRFLNRLYEETNGNEKALKNMSEIGRGLELSSDEIRKIVEYLVGENLVAYRAMGGFIAITHKGLVEVERVLLRPKVPTTDFPAMINILHVQNMNGSQVQQGTYLSTQSQVVSSPEIELIKSVIEKLKANLPDIPLSPDLKNEADAEIQTIEAQLKSSKPKINIIRESFQTLRNLIEGVAGNALAAELLPLFATLWP